MKLVFFFDGGPLDGNAFHFDSDKPGDSPEFGGKAYLDMRGGQLGKQFTVSNPDTPADENGTVWDFRKHVYETIKREIRDKRIFVYSKYICPLRGSFELRGSRLPVSDVVNPVTGERVSIEVMPLANERFAALIYSVSSG